MYKQQSQAYILEWLFEDNLANWCDNIEISQMKDSTTNNW